MTIRGPGPHPLDRGLDPRIRIRIHTKMSWICNTGLSALNFFWIRVLRYLQGSKRRVKERLRPYVKDAWACDLIDKLLSLDPAKRYRYPVDPSCSTETSVAEPELIITGPNPTVHFFPGAAPPIRP